MNKQYETHWIIHARHTLHTVTFHFVSVIPQNSSTLRKKNVDET